MTRYTFVGGKGGVGKTTIASAMAVRAARTGPTLLVSTDPAHSTADVFGQQFDDDPTPVDGHDGLWAMEIDPDEEVERHMLEIRRRMADQVSVGIVNELTRHLELAHQTPGAYESALFDRFIDVMETEAHDYDRVVFDTAPTGGTLRLLALPELLEGWIDRLIDKRVTSIDLFEKAAIGNREARRKLENDPIIGHLQTRKERFEFAGDQLRNESDFFLVLNPDSLSINETARTIDNLASFDLRIDGLVVNKLTPAPDEDERGRGAAFLRDRRQTEHDRLDRIRAELAPPVLAEIEFRTREIEGDLLTDVAGELPPIAEIVS